MSRMLVVGSLAYDDLQLPSGSFDDVWGGSATYASLSASMFTKVDLVAVVGDDFGQDKLDLFTQHGVDTAGVERAKGKSFHWKGRYSNDLTSRETLDTQLNVFADFRPKLPAIAARAPFVMLGNIHPLLQAEVLDQCSTASSGGRPRLVVADTMNFWISGERKALVDLLPRVDVLVINEEEVRQLGERHNVFRAARAVLGMGPRFLVVKRGEYGAMLFDRTADGAPFFAPAYPLEDVVDPTGAGDTFAGGFLGYLAHADSVGSPLDGGSLRRAIVAGSSMASFCVEAVGPAKLLALRGEDVRRRLAHFRSLVHVEQELDALQMLR